jgi:hypothetical protein
MTKISALVIVFLLSSVSSPTVAQDRGGAKSEASTFPVRLLPEYKVVASAGIDTWGATISKEGGVKIELYQGLHVGVAADSVETKDVAWREEQVVNGQQVICVYTKSNDLVISIPKLIANFQSHIRSQQDLADMLLMVLTYEPTHGYPVEPGTVVVTPRGNR